ncbi:MAG TPA: hypothetical protein DDZ51_28520 [Planctomycetaceae bacterium]|nr:hypothetical protein [Planctomycetaceae bacterium]
MATFVFETNVPSGSGLAVKRNRLALCHVALLIAAAIELKHSVRACLANNNTRKSEMRPAGVEFQEYNVWTGVQLTLQFDRFNFSDESLVVVGQEPPRVAPSQREPIVCLVPSPVPVAGGAGLSGTHYLNESLWDLSNARRPADEGASTRPYSRWRVPERQLKPVGEAFVVTVVV